MDAYSVKKNIFLFDLFIFFNNNIKRMNDFFYHEFGHGSYRLLALRYS